LIKCSLCEQEFDENDPLIEQRKKRHEIGRHTHHTVVNQRDGSTSVKPMGNFNYGKVVWRTECKICHLELLTCDTIENGICENCEDEN